MVNYSITKYLFELDYLESLVHIYLHRWLLIDEYTSLTNESIRGYREIKTLGIIKNIQNDVSSIIKSLLNKSIKENNIIVISNLVSQIFRGMLEVGVILTCAILIGKDKLSISFFIAMTYYIYQYTYIIQA